MTDSIKGTRGVLVHMGLGQPSARAFVIGSVVGAVALAAKFLAAAFREEAP